MYSKDDINLQKTYQQVNEVFGRSHAKLLGSKLLSKLGSSTFETKARAISYANSAVRDLKIDAEEQKADINDPDWLDSWMLENFGFSPKRYDIIYKPGQTQSDYIRYALAARLKSRQKHLQQRKAQATAKEEAEMPKKEAAPKPASSPTVDEDDEIIKIIRQDSNDFSFDEPDTSPSTTTAPAPANTPPTPRPLVPYSEIEPAIEDEEVDVSIDELEIKREQLRREAEQVEKQLYKARLKESPEGKKLQQVQQSMYDPQHWRRRQ